MVSNQYRPQMPALPEQTQLPPTKLPPSSSSSSSSSSSYSSEFLPDEYSEQHHTNLKML